MSKKYKRWHYCNIYPNAKIGEGTKIGSYTEVGDKVIIGKDCTISSFVFTCAGVEIKDNCFVGPGVIFLNDKYPPSGGVHWARITVEKGAKIGGGVVVLPGVVIGESALIGAGSVVTKSVPAGEIWCGNPAKKLK